MPSKAVLICRSHVTVRLMISPLNLFRHKVRFGTFSGISSIHSKGLFARKYIGAGEIIGVLDGVPASDDGEHAGTAATRESRRA